MRTRLGPGAWGWGLTAFESEWVPLVQPPLPSSSKLAKQLLEDCRRQKGGTNQPTTGARNTELGSWPVVSYKAGLIVRICCLYELAGGGGEGQRWGAGEALQEGQLRPWHCMGIARRSPSPPYQCTPPLCVQPHSKTTT